MFTSPKFNPAKIATTSILALSLAIPTSMFTPRSAQADLGDALVGAAIGGIIVCGATKACGGKKQTATRKKSSTKTYSSSGGGDAIALNRNNKMDIQQGLQHLGYYQGRIDGSFGAGTRGSIRNYQAYIGQPSTGYLTGEQIHDLISLSPRYVTLADNDPSLFDLEIGPDVDRNDVVALQAGLNNMGYNAGAVDGSMGGQTRAAIASYRRDSFINGQYATKRLLAHMEGRPYTSPARARLSAMAGGNGTAALPVTVARANVATPTSNAQPPAASTNSVFRVDLEMMGMQTGISAEDVSAIAQSELGQGMIVEMANGAEFGGDAVFNQAQVLLTPSWPQDGANRVMAVFDDSAPEFGALGIFRSIKMPDSVTEDVFNTAVLPDIIAQYGAEARVPGTTTWIGDPLQRAAAAANPAAMASCGQLALLAIEPGRGLDTWSYGNGPILDTASLETVTQACGDVLTVNFADNTINIGLWNSDAIMQRRGETGGTGSSVIPAIKF